MDGELQFMDRAVNFYTRRDREFALRENVLQIWKFPS